MTDQSTGGEGGGRNKPPDIPARCRKQERNRRVPEAGRSQYPVLAMGSMTNLSADGARERGPSRRISRLSVGNRNGIRGSPRDAANTHRPDDGEPMTAPSSDGAGERWRRAGGYPQAMPGPGTEPPRPRTAAQCWRKRLQSNETPTIPTTARRRTPGRRATDRRRSAQRALRRDEQRRRATQRVRQPAKSRGRGRGKPSTMSRISGANEAAMPGDAQRYAVKWRRKATNGKRPRKPDDNAARQQQPRNTISRQ